LVATLDQVFREEWGRVLATLIGLLGDFDLAEEAAQEAFAIAADRWPRDGTPSNPRAATEPSPPSSACSSQTIVLR
jgi:RNA polymerase sigma-70 factor, ECF subfamily